MDANVTRRVKLIAAGAVAGAVAALATGFTATTALDIDEPLTGDTYRRAVAAALEHVGEGKVIETAAGDDGAAYEVEIRLRDGEEVEVNLDDRFRVIGYQPDDGRPSDGD